MNLLPRRIILLASITAYCLVSSDKSSSFRTYELEEGTGQHGPGGERYTYRNDRSSVQGPSGQPEDENLNPFFPPRSDAFWEEEKQSRGISG